MGNGQNPGLNLEELYEQGRQAQPEFQAFGQNFLQRLQEKYPGTLDNVRFEVAPLKRMERLIQKVEGDYGGDHSKVADIVRGRFLAETPQQIDIIRREMDSSRSELRIEKFKDFYAQPFPSHFRTLNTQVRMPNGHVTEFRVDQYDIAAASDAAHRLYEEQQKIDRAGERENRALTPEEAARREELLERQRALYDPAARKAGLDVLLNEQGRAALAEASRVSISENHGRLVPWFNHAAGAVPHAALGLSAYGIGMRSFGLDAGYEQDITAGGERAFYARSSFGMDITAAGADTASLAGRGLSASRVDGASAFLSRNAGRYALTGLEKAAVPLSIGAGAFETAAAVRAHDPQRAAGAGGCTVGGIAGGGLLGMALGSETGPGAILTGIAGGIAGCVVGEKAAKRYATGFVADMMGDPIDPLAAQYGGLADSDHYTGSADTDSQAAPDSFMGRVIDRDGDGKFSMDEHMRLYRSLGFVAKNGKIVMDDVNFDHALTGSDAVAAIRGAFRMKDREIWAAQNHLTGLSADELRDYLVEEGTIPDPVTWQGRSMDARDALKNPEFVQKNIETLEIIHARGDGDFKETISALRQLRSVEPSQQAYSGNALAAQFRPSF